MERSFHQTGKRNWFLSDLSSRYVSRLLHIEKLTSKEMPWLISSRVINASDNRPTPHRYLKLRKNILLDTWKDFNMVPIFPSFWLNQKVWARNVAIFYSNSIMTLQKNLTAVRAHCHCSCSMCGVCGYMQAKPDISQG